MKKNFTVSLIIALVFVCLMAQTAYAADVNGAGTLKYKGEAFQVRVGEIGKDDKGDTTIEILANFKTVTQDPDPTLALGAAMDMLNEISKVKIVAHNKTIESSTFTTKPGDIKITPSGNGMMITIERIIYQFATTAQPEKIIVYNGQGSSGTFDGKTKKIR